MAGEKTCAAVNFRTSRENSVKRREQPRPGIEITGDENSVRDVRKFLDRQKCGGRAQARLDESAIEEEQLASEKNLEARIEIAKHPELAAGDASGCERIEEDGAAGAGELDVNKLAKTGTRVRNGVIGKKFERGTLADCNANFLHGGMAEGTVDARGRRSGKTGARAVADVNMRRKKIAAENAARGIEKHGVSRAVVKRDRALDLQRKRVATAGENRASTAALEGQRKKTVAADAIGTARAFETTSAAGIALVIRPRREDRGESSRRRR